VAVKRRLVSDLFGDCPPGSGIVTAGRRQRIGVLAMTLLLIASGALAGIGAADHDPSAGSGAADEVYVNDDGDVVAVYESGGSTDSSTNTEFGVDVASGLAYVLVTDPIEGSTSARGNLSAVATPDSMQIDGMLSVPNPDAIESFSLDASSKMNRQTARGDVSFSATTSGTSTMQMLDSVSTSGSVTVSASQFTAEGSVQGRVLVPMGQSASMDVSLQEQGDSYTLRMAQHQAISEWQVDQWETRSAAKRNIERQFASLAAGLGGDASVTLESYSLTEGASGRYVLDVEYTVTYTGIDKGLERALESVLAQNPDVSQSQAASFAEAASNLQVNDVGFGYEVDGGQFSASFDVDLQNYNDFLVGYLDIVAATTDAGSYEQQVERMKTQFEAQKAANMEQRYSWSGSLSHPDSDTTTYELTMKYRTSNWAAYTDELAAEDVPVFDSSTELTGSIDGDRLVFSGSLSTSGDGLFQKAFEQQFQAATLEPQTAKVLQAFQNAQPQKAKLKVDVDGERVRMEAGAKFGNLAALRDAMAEQSGTAAFSEAVGRTQDGTTSTYVRYDGAVSGDASKSDVRSLSYVDSETKIHLAGEWDQDFPTTDKQRARNFLGTGSGDSTGSSGPGFGVTATLAALLAAALFAARYRS